MLEKLAKKRKPIAIIFGAILLVTFLLDIIFGNPEDKIAIIAATVISFPMFYFAIQLGFKVVRIHAPLKYIRFLSYFFLIVTLIQIVVFLPNYIRDFPNGSSPLVSCIMGIWLGVLTDAQKHIEDQ